MQVKDESVKCPVCGTIIGNASDFENGDKIFCTKCKSIINTEVEIAYKVETSVVGVEC